MPVAQLSDGTPVVQENNEGGFGERMIPYEWYRMPVFNRASAVELSVMACTGVCGLGAVFGGLRSSPDRTWSCSAADRWG